jgi:nitrite reductase/ring-hydroxylating ferredoxin subunit
VSFISVARKSEIPEGAGITVDVKGMRIALFKVDDTIYAINNSCIHRGGPLAEGQVEGTTVTCPWHLWRFNLKTGESEISPEARVPAYQVKIQGDDVLIEI